MADGGHASYPVDVAAVETLADRMRAVAGDTEADFVFATIDSRDGMIQHYAVPNSAGASGKIVALLERIGAEPHKNTYFAASLFRSGAVTENSGRTKRNVIGVLGAVCDFDAKNDPATRHERMPLPAGAEVETSPGNFQCAYWFDRPYAGEEIEPTLHALADVTSADDCKSVEHLWRVPGTWNWPDRKKLAAGRSPIPFQARWAIAPELWDSVTADALRAAILAKDPAALDRRQTIDEGGFDWSIRKRPGEPAILFDDGTIAMALWKSGDRSKAAFTFIRRLQRANYSAAESVAALLKFSNAPVMAHYGEPPDEARVRDDVRRAFAKKDEPTYERSAAMVFRDYAERTNEAGEQEHANAAPRVIRVLGGALPVNVNDAELALIETETGIFQRGEMLVRAGEVVVEVRGRRKAKDLLLVRVNRSELSEHMTAAAQFVRWDARKDDWRQTNCPAEVADAYLARVGRWRLRPLMGLVNAPTLRADGSLLDVPGYDAGSGLIYDPRGASFPAIPIKLSRDDALAAVKNLEELIGGFPFATREARAVALAGFLTVSIRRTLTAAPLFGIDGTGAGSGKRLLADTIATVGSGRAASPITAGKDEAETEKRIASMLLRGDLALCLDNITEPIESAFLCSVLTQGMQSVRVLGQSRVITTPTNALFLATGNGLAYTGDLWRRALTALIDPAMERPSERVFDFSPIERARRDRGRYVAAALTILRAYQVAGSPAQSGRPMGSFENWCRTVRDALLWLGEADPVATCIPPADDPERERFAAVILGWKAIIGEGKGVTLKDAIRLASEAACERPSRAELFDAFHAVAAPMVRGGSDSKVDPRRLGYWLRSIKRQVIRGSRLMPDGQSHGGLLRWRLERASGRAAT